MRSYLQRLVSTANGAQSSLQPVVGSIFSPAAPPDERIPSLLADDAGSAEPFRVAGNAQAHDPCSRDIRSEKPFEGASDDSVHEAVSRMPLARTSKFEPLLTAEKMKPAIAEPAATPPVLQYSAAAPLFSCVITASEKREQSRATTPKTTVYVPLLDARSIAPPHQPVASATQEHNRTKLPKTTTKPRSTSAAITAPDEIQIHIGRIEVTAIHPPAPTVSKARHKEISLDAYLQRRDERSMK